MLNRGRRVRMHLKSGTSLEGVLLRRTFGRTYQLELVSVLEDPEATVEIQGRVRVPRETVLFWQEISP